MIGRVPSFILWRTILFSSTSLAFCVSSLSKEKISSPPAWGVRGGDLGDHEDVEKPSPCVQVPPFWEKSNNQKKLGMVLMDVFSPYGGQFLAKRAKESYGVATIMVLSDYLKGYFSKEQPEDKEHWFPMSLPKSEDLEKWKSQIPCDELVTIYCESDSGLADAEQFGSALNVTHHNGILEARRNKFLMNELTRKAGIPVVKQRLCETIEEARSFAQELFESNLYISGQSRVDETSSPESTDEAFQMEPGAGILGKGSNIPEGKARQCCVVKPIRGVASECVFLCHTTESVEEAFSEICASAIFGSPREKHKSVLVQEFAAGTEYAVDIVSKNGEHKVAALWRYDKRPANGAPFVYYATELVDASRSEDGSLICEYAKKVLDALDLKWGLTHNEFILSKDGPRLVEVNCRQHNMDFLPLTMACIGYNAFDMLLAAYLGDAIPTDTNSDRLDWDSLPSIPSLRALGAMVHLVNSADGTLTGVNHLQSIHGLESVFEMEVYDEFLRAGGEITPTIDIRTDAGWVQLINDDPIAFQQDFQKIVQFMPTMFEVEKNEY